MGEAEILREVTLGSAGPVTPDPPALSPVGGEGPARSPEPVPSDPADGSGYAVLFAGDHSEGFEAALQEAIAQSLTDHRSASRWLPLPFPPEGCAVVAQDDLELVVRMAMTVEHRTDDEQRALTACATLAQFDAEDLESLESGRAPK